MCMCMRPKDRAGAACAGNFRGKERFARDELSLPTGELALQNGSQSNERLVEALFCGRVVDDPKFGRTGGVGDVSCHFLSVSLLVIELRFLEFDVAFAWYDVQMTDDRTCPIAIVLN